MNYRRFLYPFIVAIIASFLPITALSAPWYQPDDVNPGDSYQIAFVTSTQITAEETDVQTYRDHVNNAADNDAELGALSFNPIISTTNTDARDNAVIYAPVYNTHGSLVATAIGDFWDDKLENPIAYDEKRGYNERWVWTGTNAGGYKDFPFGNPYVMTGYSSVANGLWVRNVLVDSRTPGPLYGLSETITAVPIPGAVWLLGSSLIGLVGIRRKVKK